VRRWRKGKSGRNVRLIIAGLMALALLGVCAAADPKPLTGETRTVFFNTWPTGARVLLQDPQRGPREIGVSGKSIELDLSALPGKSDFSVVFSLNGYKEKHEKIPIKYFRTNARYPSSGALRLEAVSPFTDFLYLVKENIIPVIGGLIILISIAAYLFYLRMRRQAEYRVVERTAPPPARDQSRPDVRASSERGRTETRPDEGSASQAPVRDSSASRQAPSGAPVQSDDPRIGRQYGQWRIVEKLSTSGTYSIYRALPKSSTDDSHSVLVKVTALDAGDDDTFVQRFRREISITSELNHPNIIRVHGWGEEKGELYYATDLVRGKSLRTKILPGGLLLKDFLHIFKQICEGLGYAHDNGIVHRDVKPENIYINDHGRVIITDFTIAKGFAHVEITTSSMAFGTPGYMAPEQLQGATLDPRSDQYSLGVVAYELLAGCKPFPEVSLMAAIMQQLNEEPPPLSNYRSDVPAAVEKMVMRMLAKKPVERFYDLREVLKYIKNEITNKRDED
jgi:hypothetical protein